MVIFKNEKYNSKAVFQIKGHLHKMSKLSRLSGQDKENATKKAEWNCSYRISLWKNRLMHSTIVRLDHVSQRQHRDLNNHKYIQKTKCIKDNVQMYS